MSHAEDTATVQAYIAVAGTSLGLLAGCGATACPAAGSVVHLWPHDPVRETQGLVYSSGILYESAGGYSRSKLSATDLARGHVSATRPLPADRYGEGIAVLRDRLYQLTWREGVGYVYIAGSLAPVDSFHYAGEGWGLTADGHRLVMSDGTSKLRFLDTARFEVRREITVRLGAEEVHGLNELEYANGTILANVLGRDFILRIDPLTGRAVDQLDLRFLRRYVGEWSLLTPLNGIALVPTTGHLLVTGKRWPVIVELCLSGMHGSWMHVHGSTAESHNA